MPDFCCVFDGPVVDQPDHPKRRRVVAVEDGLLVSGAATPTAAMQHALRVTRGEATLVAVYDAAGTRVWGEGPETRAVPAPVAPAVEVSQDQLQVFGEGITHA